MLSNQIYICIVSNKMSQHLVTRTERNTIIRILSTKFECIYSLSRHVVQLATVAELHSIRNITIITMGATTIAVFTRSVAAI